MNTSAMSENQINIDLRELAYKNFFYFGFAAIVLWIFYILFDFIFATEFWILFLPTRIVGALSTWILWYLAKNRRIDIYMVQDIFASYLIVCLTFYMCLVNMASISIYYTGYGMVVVLVFSTFIFRIEKLIIYFLAVLLSFSIIFLLSRYPTYTHLGLGVFAVFSELLVISVVNHALNKKYLSEIKSRISLSESRNTLEAKQKEILDSIYYAKRIQYTLLAHKDLLQTNLSEHFVMFKPKDIVSGDFYWATEQDDKFYLAVCDCTGHGVPGAFMSLLNIGFLSEAIKEKNIEKPGDIFNYVRERLISSISNEEQKDGMDGILICYNKSTKELSFAAANNSPILISNNKISELNKDRMPIGKGEREMSFTTSKINYQSGDVLYLYTDGYADQFGGPKGKKFKYGTLNESLLSISNKNVSEQKDILEQQFNGWKGNLEQVDDVLLIGIRL